MFTEEIMSLFQVDNEEWQNKSNKQNPHFFARNCPIRDRYLSLFFMMMIIFNFVSACFTFKFKSLFNLYGKLFCLYNDRYMKYLAYDMLDKMSRPWHF